MKPSREGEVALRRLDLSELVEKQRQIRVRHHRGRIDLEQPVHLIDGLVVAPETTEDDPHGFKGVGPGRTDGRRTLEQLEGAIGAVLDKGGRCRRGEPIRHLFPARRRQDRQGSDPSSQRLPIGEDTIDFAPDDPEFPVEGYLQPGSALPPSRRQRRARRGPDPRRRTTPPPAVPRRRTGAASSRSTGARTAPR